MSYSYKCYSDTKDFMKKFVNAEEGAIIYGMYLEDESHSYHISSLMDRKMKGEKLDGNLVKGRKRSGGSLLYADRSEA